MKTLFLTSLVAAGLVAAGPALADFNSTGDGIFGHEYRTQRTIVAPETHDLSIGYSDAVSSERTGSVKAVNDQVRGERANGRTAVPQATGKTSQDSKADVRR